MNDGVTPGPEQPEITEASDPLWLPKGSVRALLALILVGVPYGRIAMGLPVEQEVLFAALGVSAGYGLIRSISK